MSDTISLLCPTRGRAPMLAASVRLARELAARPERVETLLAVDDDDATDYAKIWATYGKRDGKPAPWRVFRGPRRGYARLFECFNFLAKQAAGRWCFLWNDDIFCSTPRWDAILDGVPGEVAVAMTESNHGRSPCTFPAFTKSYADVLGHVSLQTHNDTWIEEVGRMAGVTVDVPILLLHAYADDAVARDGKADGRIEASSQEFYSKAMTETRIADAKRITDHLAAKKAAVT